MNNHQKNQEKQFIKVVPNPASESCMFRYQLPVDWPGTIEIYNLLNERIDQVKVNPNSSSLYYYSGRLKCGFYLFRLISDGNAIGTGKLAIVR